MCVTQFPLMVNSIFTGNAIHFLLKYQCCSGSKHYLVNMEARSIHSQTTTHRCLMGRIQDVSVTMIRELASSGAGALLILLPEDMTTLSPDEEMVRSVCHVCCVIVDSICAVLSSHAFI